MLVGPPIAQFEQRDVALGHFLGLLPELEGDRVTEHLRDPGRRRRRATPGRTCSCPFAGCRRWSGSAPPSALRRCDRRPRPSSAIASAHARRMSSSSSLAHMFSTKMIAFGESAPSRWRASSTCSLKAMTTSAVSPQLVTGRGGDADPIAACALRRAGGRFDFGGDDFDGPDAVAHPGGHLAEQLPAFLSAFAGIGDNLDDVFLDEKG